MELEWRVVTIPAQRCILMGRVLLRLLLKHERMSIAAGHHFDVRLLMLNLGYFWWTD